MTILVGFIYYIFIVAVGNYLIFRHFHKNEGIKPITKCTKIITKCE